MSEARSQGMVCSNTCRIDLECLFQMTVIQQNLCHPILHVTWYMFRKFMHQFCNNDSLTSCLHPLLNISSAETQVCSQTL